METIKSVTQTYLKSKGMILDGEGWVSPLMPYLIMDMFYDIYTKKILSLSLRHEQKKKAGEISRMYKTFNDVLFRPQTEDGKVLLTDLMDELVEATHNTRVKLKCALMDCLSFEEFEIREVHASMVLADALVSLANGYWAECYRNRQGQEVENELLTKIGKRVFYIMNYWHPLDRNINCSNDDKVSALIKMLIRETTDFCFRYDLPKLQKQVQ